MHSGKPGRKWDSNHQPFAPMTNRYLMSHLLNLNSESKSEWSQTAKDCNSKWSTGAKAEWPLSKQALSVQWSVTSPLVLKENQPNNPMLELAMMLLTIQIPSPLRLPHYYSLPCLQGVPGISLPQNKTRPPGLPSVTCVVFVWCCALLEEGWCTWFSLPAKCKGNCWKI